MAINLKKIPDYDVYITIEAYSLGDFNDQCNKLSSLGFKRVGDIVVGGGGYTYYQQWMKEKPIV